MLLGRARHLHLVKGLCCCIIWHPGRSVHFAVYGGNTSSGREVLQQAPIIVEFVTKQHAQDMKEVSNGSTSTNLSRYGRRPLRKISTVARDNPFCIILCQKIALSVSCGWDLAKLRNSIFKQLELRRLRLVFETWVDKKAYDKLKQLKLPKASIQIQFDLLGEKLDNSIY